MKRLILNVSMPLIAIYGLAACGSDGSTSKSAEFKKFIKSEPIAIAAGDPICEYGGIKREMGIDWNDNNILEASEIKPWLRSYECDGKDGEITICGFNLCTLGVNAGIHGTSASGSGQAGDGSVAGGAGLAGDGNVGSGSGQAGDGSGSATNASGSDGTSSGNPGGSGDDGTLRVLSFSGSGGHLCDDLCGVQYVDSYSYVSASGKNILFNLVALRPDGSNAGRSVTATWANGSFNGGDDTVHDGEGNYMYTSNGRLYIGNAWVHINADGVPTSGGGGSHTASTLCWTPKSNGKQSCINYAIN